MAKTTQVLNDERHERHLLRLRGIAESKQEDARRLSRYDEAIRLLRMISGMAVHWEPLTPGDIREVNNFLAAEPTEKGGEG